jgi:hypothetical protein
MAATLKQGDSLPFTLKNASGTVSYSSSNTAAATIDNNGMLTAVGNGETKVKAVDQDGSIVESLSVYVGSGGGPAPDPGAQCPYPDPQLCQLFCQIEPTLPWCH